jgi:hypothetical protein
MSGYISQASDSNVKKYMYIELLLLRNIFHCLCDNHILELAYSVSDCIYYR